MTLRTATVQITREGRDKGGVFVITEKPAVQATEWFLRAAMLLIRSGADVPPDIMQHGPAGMVTLGIGTVLTGLGKAPWFEVKPLLDELLSCITSYHPPGGNMPLGNWQVIAGQIQEPATILQLHEEVVSLHLGFSLAARLSTFREMAAGMIAGLTPNTETSIAPSDASSAPVSPA
jgi:hypothetical protein